MIELENLRLDKQNQVRHNSQNIKKSRKTHKTTKKEIESHKRYLDLMKGSKGVNMMKKMHVLTVKELSDSQIFLHAKIRALTMVD